jgi:hypothetical protein
MMTYKTIFRLFVSLFLLLNVLRLDAAVTRSGKLTGSDLERANRQRERVPSIDPSELNYMTRELFPKQRSSFLKNALIGSGVVVYGAVVYCAFQEPGFCSEKMSELYESFRKILKEKTTSKALLELPSQSASLTAEIKEEEKLLEEEKVLEEAKVLEEVETAKNARLMFFPHIACERFQNLDIEGLEMVDTYLAIVREKKGEVSVVKELWEVREALLNDSSRYAIPLKETPRVLEWLAYEISELGLDLEEGFTYYLASSENPNEPLCVLTHEKPSELILSY